MRSSKVRLLSSVPTEHGEFLKKGIIICSYHLLPAGQSLFQLAEGSAHLAL